MISRVSARARSDVTNSLSRALRIRNFRHGVCELNSIQDWFESKRMTSYKFLEPVSIRLLSTDNQ